MSMQQRNSYRGLTYGMVATQDGFACRTPCRVVHRPPALRNLKTGTAQVMPVTPTPRTIQIDLSEEYLDFLDMATDAGSLSRQEVMRQALAMLKDADLTPEQLRSQLALFGKRHAADLKQPALTAWDR